MAALVLSASGCFNENEMSSPEGTVKGYYKAAEQLNWKKMLDYCDPREMTEEEMQEERKWASKKTFLMKPVATVFKNQFFTDVKTTLVSKKESLVWKGDKWGNRMWATVEVSYKLNGENIQQTVELVLMDNKWYVTNWEELGT